MPASTKRRLPLARDVLGLAGFVAVCLAVAGLGGAITAASVGAWYPELHKPPFNPPDWVFAPVWTILYVLMAIAGWRVWRRAGFGGARTALSIFAFQLVLNLGWSSLFFGLRQVGLALVEIVILLLFITINALLFWRIDPLAGALFVPYGLWVAFATFLNAALWVLN